MPAFFLQHAARDGEGSEYTDRTGKGQPVGHDRIGRAGDVVTSRSGIAAHRNHDGLLGLKKFHFAPYDIRRERAAAGRVDTQHDRLDILVSAHLG